MGEIITALELDHALHLGLLAVSLTVLAWRFTHVGELVKQIILWRSAWDRGEPHPGGRTSIMFLLGSAVCCAVGLITFLTLVYVSLQFFEQVELILKRAAVDAGKAAILAPWGVAEALTKQATGYTIISLLAFFGDFACEVAFSIWVGSLDHVITPPLGHVHALPRHWTAAPEALWDRRLRTTSALTNRAADVANWRTSWQAWAALVHWYRDGTLSDN